MINSIRSAVAGKGRVVPYVYVFIGKQTYVVLVDRLISVFSKLEVHVPSLNNLVEQCFQHEHRG